MSTVTPAQNAVAVGAAEPSASSVVRGVVRYGGPVALAVGALLAASGMALHLGAMPEDERLAIAIAEDPQWLTSHLFLGIGFALVAIGAATAVSVVRGRGAPLAATGAIVTMSGALAMSLSDMAHGAVGFALGDHVDPTTSLEIHFAYFEHPAILGLNIGPMLLTLGMVLLGAGMLRSRDVPRWEGAVVLLAPIAVHAAFNFGAPTYVHGLPLLLGMTVVARRLARR